MSPRGKAEPHVLLRLARADWAGASVPMNAAHVAARKANFLARSLEELELPDAGFDKVFAASVNLFWVRPAGAKLAAIARWLRPRGGLFLFYEAFTESHAAELEAALLAHLGDAGFEASAEREGRRVAVSARPSTPR